MEAYTFTEDGKFEPIDLEKCDKIYFDSFEDALDDIRNNGSMINCSKWSVAKDDYKEYNSGREFFEVYPFVTSSGGFWSFASDDEETMEELSEYTWFKYNFREEK